MKEKNEIIIERWMSYLPPEKKLVLINIPGSHDSAAYNINFFGAKFAKTQDYDIKSQLKIGVRKFDIRVAIRQPFFQKLSQEVINNNEDLICVHGICDCYQDNSNTKHLTYKEVLLEIKKFLIQNPYETIILETDSGRGNRYENIKRATEIADEILEEDNIILYNRDLTLAEARGKVVCTTFITNEKNSDEKHKYNIYIPDGRGLDEIHKNLGGDYETFKTDGDTKVRELQKLFGQVESFECIEKDFKYNNKNYPLVYSISCTGEKKNLLFYPDPKSQFNIVSKFFMGYELKKEYYYGWINIDFVDLDITKKIIETNFKEEIRFM